MITIDDNKLTYLNMGLFDTESEWIHSRVTVESHELVYVTSGTVALEENKERFLLEPCSALILSPNVPHGGYQSSHGHTAFYWLHFLYEGEPLPKLSNPPFPETESALKEIMHLSQASHRLAEIALAKLLFSLGERREYRNKLAYEVAEFVRVKARSSLSVADVARRFGYSADYLSRVCRREFGYDLRTLIIKQRLGYAESMLINTDFSVKEVANSCGYEDENAFIKFFTYHEHTTPSLFRNKFFYVHMNTR